MRHIFAGAVCILALSACGKSELVQPETPISTLQSGIKKENFDTGIRPQDDFFKAINGQWLKNTPIPADKTSYGAFHAIADTTEKQLHAIIEELAATSGKSAGSNEQKIGDMYASFMNEATIEAQGLKPLQGQLDAIDAIRDRRSLLITMARLQQLGIDVPLQPYVSQDAKDSKRHVAEISQAGLSLPDRDYYLIDDKQFAEIRSGFVSHMQRMLSLANIADPAGSARKVAALEKQIAEAQWDKVDNRDPIKTYNTYKPTQLRTLTSAIDWPSYLQETGFAGQQQIIVEQPSYITGLGKLLTSTPLSTWKAYLKWQVLHAYAQALPHAYAQEDFAFFQQTLNGAKEQRPRWKRGVSAVEGSLGEALGKEYVERHFPPENKARMEALVRNLIAAYGQAMDKLDWMSEDTRQAAKAKLAKFTYKIGYPNQWRDYSPLHIASDDLIGNLQRAQAFEYQRNLAKLGKPVDPNEWGMTPQTVNAYYNPLRNEIVFPAAILQPPFFNMNAEDAVNYGGIGAVIGHEISHGFDDQGSQFDGDGNLREWWTKADRERFEKRAAALAEQYSAYEPVPGYHINGRFTLGENIADLGGVTISYSAYHLSLGNQPAPVIDGMTAEQRFFAGWAQVWCTKYTQQNLLNRLKTDPHSPAQYRTNGVLSNVPGFYEAYDVKPSDQMYLAPEKRIKIW
jgi:predicted metalloendopeptidase